MPPGYLDTSPLGVLYQQDQGPDPRTMGILGLGLAMQRASGPSMMPRSLGSIMGEAGTEGLGIYAKARQQQTQDAMTRQTMALNALKMQKEAADLELQRQLTSSGLFGNMSDPDKLEALGTRLAAGGHAGGASLIAQAEKIRQRRQEQQTADSFKSRPGVLGAGVTTNSPQGQALLSNLSGDQEFDRAVLDAQNEALNSNPRLKPQAMEAPRQGLFAPLVTSPYVGQFAQQLQGQLDTTSGLNPQQWLQQYDRLQQQHVSSTNQASARAETADLRRELAGNSDNTRRMLAGLAYQGRADRQQDMSEQRAFTKERGLANDYNGLSKDFRAVMPAFSSAAKYLDGGKYDSSGDRALVFAFARTLDPRDRVSVRDVSDINKLGNVPERIVQAVKGVAEGKMLPDRIRMEMFGVMRNQFDSMNEQQTQIEDEYETRARQYMLRPENVVTRFAVRKEQQPKPSPTPKPSPGTRRIRFDAQGHPIP